ncbi:stage II sporulation protein M [Paenibacillus sp. MWE-103]|uniref:Stage II sporulation protein M n=1 Tax=Paenibacillus artemisiicola TaxID=1172618 RepID=A0ABS3WGW8_9BACL|nr:stage II sporulation protein M [Paenibacillus artemisiicola]MBO7747574.1 stage II sporulation protein M [Paenibacillus artemisiicola]
MFAPAEIFRHLKSMRHYLAFSTVFLLAGMVVGATNPGLDSFMQSQMSGLKNVAQTIDASSHPTLFFMGFIFLNNAIKAIFVMYLGALFGIVPIVFLAINGMLIGYLIHRTAEQGGGDMVFTVVVKGLLPHGIIELAAIVIACAYGLRFGKLTLQGVGTVFKRTSGWGRQFEQFLQRTVPVIVLIVVMLIVAAVIESTVTVWLLGE